MDLIDREAAITSLTFAEETGRMSCGELKGVIEVLNRLPSAQPTQHNTFNALESLDCIDRQAAIDALKRAEALTRTLGNHIMIYTIQELPSAQPEIIRCNSCKHWTQTIGEMRGFGLGICDFHNAEYVTCNGFCYWAERREGEQNG